MSNKIRTVFYAEEGLKTFVDSVLRHENFKSESDVIGYLCALGMQEHRRLKIIELGKGETDETAMEK